MDDDLKLRFEERAAIKEYLGKLPRKQAEEEAWDELMEELRCEAQKKTDKGRDQKDGQGVD